jgi:hypothetical protein
MELTLKSLKFLCVNLKETDSGTQWATSEDIQRKIKEVEQLRTGYGAAVKSEVNKDSGESLSRISGWRNFLGEKGRLALRKHIGQWN